MLSNRKLSARMAKPCASLMVAALLAAPSASHALSFGAGPVIGAEFANASVEDHSDTEGRTGLAVGLRTEFGVTSPYSLLVEPTYVQKGAEFETLGITTKGELDYLEVPILLKAKFGAMKAHGYAFAGPSLGFKLNADGEIGNFTGDFDDETSSFVVSGDIGVGAGFQVQKFVYLNADVRYSHGFMNALEEDVGDIESWQSRDIRLLACVLIHLTQ
jgi:Outer membrane protein beta-barrel domain